MAELGVRHIFTKYLRQVLRPFVRLALRHGVRFPDVIDMLRSVFVEVAQGEMDRLGVRPSVSRLAVTTGLSRRDVQRVGEGGPAAEITLALPTRVVGLWCSHERFLNKQGKPRVLTVDGPKSEFHTLVSMVSNDVHPASVLFELERVRVVERTPRGVQLVTEGYIPRFDPEQGIRMLAQDMEQLLFSVDENIFSDRAEKNLHVRTVSSHIGLEDVSTVRDWLLKEGGAFHRKVRAFLADYDLQLSPRADRTPGAEVLVTSFGRVVTEERKGNEASPRINPQE